VLRGGRSLVFCEGEVRDASGEVMAKGIGTFRLKRQMEAGDSK
jgi:acyl-coenzyme A thioesterase PaaI-like protein